MTSPKPHSTYAAKLGQEAGCPDTYSSPTSHHHPEACNLTCSQCSELAVLFDHRKRCSPPYTNALVTNGVLPRPNHQRGLSIHLAVCQDVKNISRLVRKVRPEEGITDSFHTDNQSGGPPSSILCLQKEM